MLSSPNIELNKPAVMRNFTKSHKGNSLKHVLIVSGITIPLLFIFIVIFVMSFGDEYKHLKVNSKHNEKVYINAENIYEAKKNELTQLEDEHHELFQTLREPKDLEIFKDENPFIEKITALKEQTEETETLIKYVYRVETTSSNTTLRNLYDLMAKNEEFGFRFDISFPITIESDRGGERAVFNLNLYKLKKIERNLVRPYTEIQK